MKKKFAMGLITLVSAVTLAACTQTASEDTKLVTMKGDTITVSEFYDEVKNTTVAQQSMLTLILTRVFEEQYGDKVSQDRVTDSFNKTAEQYGENFEIALNQQGLTVEAYKQQIRTTMLVEYAVEEAAKAELTDEAFEEAYKEYLPEMTLQVIQLSSEDDAKAVLEEVKKDGADFEKIAKEKTTGTDVKYTVDSAATTLPADVITAAGQLDKGGVSEILPVTSLQTFTTSYYIVKVVEKTEKDADWKTYKDSLEKIVLAQKTTDANFQNQVISEALSKANVKIKDDTFANILAQYAVAETASSESSASSSQAAEEKTEEKAEETEASSETESSEAEEKDGE